MTEILPDVFPEYKGGCRMFLTDPAEEIVWYQDKKCASALKRILPDMPFGFT